MTKKASAAKRLRTKNELNALPKWKEYDLKEERRLKLLSPQAQEKEEVIVTGKKKRKLKLKKREVKTT